MFIHPSNPYIIIEMDLHYLLLHEYITNSFKIMYYDCYYCLRLSLIWASHGMLDVGCVMAD